MNRFAYYPPILGYHRVGTFKNDHVPTVSPEVFDRHLAFLTRSGYRIVSLKELAECAERCRACPRRSVAITFDDGYEEMYSVVRPLLKRFGVPATVFVSTEEVGGQGFLTWEQTVEMAREGATIGSHTMHHRYLPLVTGEQLVQELVGSKQVIERHLGHPVEFLSYPVGGFTPEVQRLARQAGYRAACTTNRLSPSQGAGLDRFALRRVKVTERDCNLWLFRAKISGYYDLFRQLRQPS